MKTTETKLNSMLGMTAEELDALGCAYDEDCVDFTDVEEVLDGSPLDYIGSKRETFVLDARQFKRVKLLAKERGCTKSDIYRKAVQAYLDAEQFAAAL
jgi:hypothetical protein